MIPIETVIKALQTGIAAAEAAAEQPNTIDSFVTITKGQAKTLLHYMELFEKANDDKIRKETVEMMKVLSTCPIFGDAWKKGLSLAVILLNEDEDRINDLIGMLNANEDDGK